jgi:hypothetical protein
VLAAPQSVLDTNFKILRALRLLFLSILIWGRKVSLLSKRRNGFKFYSSKTLGMHFCNKRGLHPDPELKLYNSPIKIVSETKFLGLLFFKGRRVCFNIQTLNWRRSERSK